MSVSQEELVRRLDGISSSQEDTRKQVNDLHALFIGVEGAPGIFIALQNKVETHEKQIRVLEKFQWVLTGGGAILAFLILRTADLSEIMLSYVRTGTSFLQHIPSLFHRV